MRANRIFRVNKNYNGRSFRWSVQAYDQTIASGTAPSQIAFREAVQKVQRDYMEQHSNQRVWNTKK